MTNLFTKACVSLFIHLEVMKRVCCAGAEQVDRSLCVRVIICCHKINRLFLTNVVKMMIYW